MNKSNTKRTSHYTPAASLAALGLKLQHVHLFDPIHQQVHIAQKTVKYTPTNKLYDGFIALLAGAQGMVEINTRLRADPILHLAFGRAQCAEQSVVQQTLDSCTAENVTQMEHAVDCIYRQHSQGYQHDYRAAWQVLDVDMSGMPCGKKAAFATKGYFANTERNRRGRQLGRVLASRYHEVIVDRLFAGNRQLGGALQPLVEAAEGTLELSEEKRRRCLVRIDAGGGSVDNFNWLLVRGYQVLGKACSGQQARLLAKTVQEWITDPHLPERQLGWVTEPPTAFVRPVRRLAVRCLKANGTWGVGVLICSLSTRQILQVAGRPLQEAADDHAMLVTTLALYDQRGGGVETSFKGGKGGLGLTKRNKKRFEAQQMVMLLGTLAHNVVVWAHDWLTAPQVAAQTALASETPATPTQTEAPLQRYGILRMVRDVFHVSGFLCLDPAGQVVEIVLNQDAHLARLIINSLSQLVAPMHIAVNLGKT